jgi:uncharacterized membrane protein HdeD (DUF308 family)
MDALLMLLVGIMLLAEPILKYLMRMILIGFIWALTGRMRQTSLQEHSPRLVWWLVLVLAYGLSVGGTHLG